LRVRARVVAWSQAAAVFIGLVVSAVAIRFYYYS
jgi:hypothetical protein